MSLPIGISSLLNTNIVESERIEIKTGWNAKSSLKTICAFANDFENIGGGYIVIGITDDAETGRNIVGVHPGDVDNIQKEIFHDCKMIKPAYMPEICVELYNGNTLIVVWVPGGGDRPYAFPKEVVKNNPDSKVLISYIRVGSVTVVPDENQQQELYTMARRVPFDDRICQTASIEDLDKYKHC